MEVKQRLYFWKGVTFTAWRWAVLTPLAAITIATWARDEFLNAEQREKFLLGGFLPGWQWEWWALAGMGLALLVMLEAAYRQNRDLRPFRHPLPGNRDALVRLLTEFEQEADVYLQKCASAGLPPRFRFMDWSRRPPVRKLLKKIQAEFRVANNEEPKAAWVEFQKDIGDIVDRGRNVTKRTLPDLRAELKTTVSKFLADLDRGGI